MSRRRASAFDDHLYHRFVVCEKKKICDSFSKRCAFEGTWSMFDRSTFWSNTCLIFGCAFDFYTSFPCARLGWFWYFVRHTQYFNNQTHESSAQVNHPFANPASNDTISDSVELWDTDACFLHIQLIGTHSTSNNAQNSAKCWFWVFKISCKVWILK